TCYVAGKRDDHRDNYRKRVPGQYTQPTNLQVSQCTHQMMLLSRSAWMSRPTLSSTDIWSLRTTTSGSSGSSYGAPKPVNCGISPSRTLAYNPFGSRS